MTELRVMRRPLSITLVVAIALSQFGATAVVLLNHRQSRRYVAELAVRWFADEGESLTHLSIPNPGLAVASRTLERLGHDEVRYRGRLYDVVSEEMRGDTLHLWAYWDHHEQEAVERLAEAVDQSGSNTGTITPTQAKNVILLYVSEDSEARVRPGLEASLLGFAPSDTPSASPSDVPHPPPEA